MPLYTISTEEGALSGEAKSALAWEITDFHCRLTGHDKKFVKIVFEAFPNGEGFVGGRVAAPTIVTVLIKIGRSVDFREKMALELWTMVQRATGARDAEMLVTIQEAPVAQAFEMGMIMPNLAS